MKKKLACYTETYCAKCGVPHALTFDNGIEEFENLLKDYVYLEPEIENLTKDQKKAISSGVMRVKKVTHGMCQECTSVHYRNKEFDRIDLYYKKKKLKDVNAEMKKLKKKQKKLETKIRVIKDKLK